MPGGRRHPVFLPLAPRLLVPRLRSGARRSGPHGDAAAWNGQSVYIFQVETEMKLKSTIKNEVKGVDKPQWQFLEH